MANILKELFRREGKDNSSATNKCYEIGVDAKNVILSSKEDDKREAYTNLADKLKIFNKMNNIRLTATEDLKKISNASGTLSHAEGYRTQALGTGSHTEGYCKREIFLEAGVGQQGYKLKDAKSGSNMPHWLNGYYWEAGYESTIQKDGMPLYGLGIYTTDTEELKGTIQKTYVKKVDDNNFELYVILENVQEAIDTSVKYCIFFGKAISDGSHAEGGGIALGNWAHAEGSLTWAAGQGHAEGFMTSAMQAGAHSEGRKTVARGMSSHAEGQGTIALKDNQHVQGQYNIPSEEFVHIVGWGSGDNDRENIHTLDKDGNAMYAGKVDVKGDLVVDGKITAKMGLVNESGSEDFKVENLQVDKVAILGEGHNIPNQNPQWGESLFEKSGSIEINNIEYLVFESLNILNSPGTLEWESNKPLSAYYGVILAGTLLEAEDGFYETGITWYGANAYYPIFFKIDKPNFVMYAPKDEMSGILLNVSKEVFLSFKYVLKDANAFKNSGVLIQGQFSDLSSDESKSLVHVIGSGTSKEDRKNIYTLDENGKMSLGEGHLSTWFGGSAEWSSISITCNPTFSGEESIIDLFKETKTYLVDLSIDLSSHPALKPTYNYQTTIQITSVSSLTRLPLDVYFIGKVTSQVTAGAGGGLAQWSEDSLMYIDSSTRQLKILTESKCSINASTIMNCEIDAYAKLINTESAISFSNGGVIAGTYTNNHIPQKKDILMAIGNGKDSNNRSNAFLLDKDGNAEFAGNIIFTDNNKNQISMQVLLNRIIALENQLKS